MVKTEVSQILRLRSRLFSELSAASRNSSVPDDFPVPFIEDDEYLEPKFSTYKMLLYICGIGALIVIVIGILKWLKKRQ
jgi:hypothetical protein